MYGILLTVTDLELTVSQIVKTILVLIIVGGVVVNLRYVYRNKKTSKKIWRIVIIIVLVILAIPILRQLQIDGALLGGSQYVKGKTLGFCSVFAKGKGIEFEYEVDGKVYINCNTYHPIPINKIIVSNGFYYVRYVKKYPEKGRIDFNKAIP